ncbi:MAG TPA: hypothetical protein DEP84_08400 [Chloroflexi bacterium]|nr:hypothetical protein [Chloroflexota bacterium]
MDQYRRGHNIKMLWASVLLGIAYASLQYSLHRLTGSKSLDGIIGVLLGLYICSHPAANMVDLLFFERGTRRRVSSTRSVIVWLALNILVLLVGWIVITIGATRFAGRAG